MPLSLLAIFAHPDDEAFAAGGTLARYAAEGVDVRLICVTRGEAGSPGRPACCPRERLGAWRTQELERSCRALGIADPIVLDQPDSQLATVDRRRLVQPLVAAIRRWRPQVVITWGPDGLTGHPDHIVLHRAAIAAFATAGNCSAFPELLGTGLHPHQPVKLYQCAMPASLVADLDSQLPGDVNGHKLGLTGVDDARITATLDVSSYTRCKLGALACHESQQHDFSRLSSRDLARLCARESFVLRRGVAAHRAEDDLFAGLRDRPALTGEHAARSAWD